MLDSLLRPEILVPVIAIIIVFLAIVFETSKTIVRDGYKLKAIDGDTIKLIYEERTKKNRNIRIAGIDTPEIRKHKCDQEKLLGLEAKKELQYLIDNHQVTFDVKGRDLYGRVLANVYIDGMNLAHVMISRGHGRENHGEKRKGWC